MLSLGISRGVEHREQGQTYAGLVLAGLVANARGRGAAVSAASGAVQAAAGLWARCLAACAVEHPAVTPEVLAAIGYDLGTVGESLWALDVGPSGLRLDRAGDWTIDGETSDPRGWRYLATFSGPSGWQSRKLDAAAVIHFRYLPDGRRPWLGVAPWKRAPMLASLAAEVETALRDEARQPVKTLVPIPQGTKEDDALAIKAAVTDRDEPVRAPETQRAGYGAGPGSAPQQDWGIKSLHVDPQAGLVKLCQDVPAALGTVYGIPPVLSNGAGTETQTREAYRRFVATGIAPIARLVGGALGAALEVPDLELDLRPLRSWDTAGQARAYHVLREGGMSDADAMEHAGLS